MSEKEYKEKVWKCICFLLIIILIGILSFAFLCIAITYEQNKVEPSGDMIYRLVGMYILGFIVALVIPFIQMGYIDSVYKTGRILSEPFPCQHFTGLSIPQNAKCMIKFGETGLSISSSGANFVLDYDRIYDIVVENETDIKKHYVSSAGGAVSGAMMFGELGAAIGGRIREIRETYTRYYLMIAYENYGRNAYLAFNVTNSETAAELNVKNIKQKGLINLQPKTYEL